jgi:DNA-binding CsgD family transcriptional regulator
VITAESLSRLLLLLYEGAATPERMQLFLSELANTMNARGGTFRDHVFEQGSGLHLKKASLFFSVGLSPEALRSYTEHFHAIDIHVQRAVERSPLADCGLHQANVTNEELRRTEIYNDYQRPFDIGPMIWGRLAEDSSHVAGLSLIRSENQPLFGPEELELLSALVPHMRQALHVSRTLRDLEASNAMLEHGLEEAGIAICLVRQDGSILRLTPGMEKIFAASDGIQSRNDRLKVAMAVEQNALDALIAGACATSANRSMESAVRFETKAAGDLKVRGWTAQAGGAMLITRKLPLRPLQAVVTPFCSGSLMNEPEATALVQFSDPSAVPRSRATVLKALYGLTPTESRLADLLLQGLDVRETADRMSITFETARFNLKRVLAKTGTRRQAELMRLMLSLPGS